jgi:hypothetical protein
MVSFFGYCSSLTSLSASLSVASGKLKTLALRLVLLSNMVGLSQLVFLQPDYYSSTEDQPHAVPFFSISFCGAVYALWSYKVARDKQNDKQTSEGYLQSLLIAALLLGFRWLSYACCF